MAPRVAIVTGANKGIGFAIVRALLKKFDGDVFLTSRDECRGKAAVEALKNEGLPEPKYHQLDIDDMNSIKALKAFMVENYAGVDVLVNNAGFAYKQSAKEDFGVQAEVSLRINYNGTINMIKEFLPITKSNGRIVSVASFVGLDYTLAKCSKERKAQFKNKDITLDQLECYLDEFIASAKKGGTEGAVKDGFATTAYGTSKLGITVATKIFAKQVNDYGQTGILLNCCNPGWVKTDMAGDKAKKTPDQGAESSIYCALLPEGATAPNGEHIDEDNSVVEWQSSKN